MSENAITAEDLYAHGDKESLWLLIHGKVYDVTKFLDEHPGGDEVILAEKGTDATEAFEDVGHSDEARELMKGMYIGDFAGDPKYLAGKAAEGAKKAAQTVVNKAPQTSVISYVLPLAFLGAYLAYRYYYTGSA